MNNYDEAYFDLNDGIALCRQCRLNYPDKFGLDCNLRNLFELKSDVIHPSCAKLKKEYPLIIDQIKNLEKKNKKLNQKNRKLRKRLRKKNGDSYE